MSMIEGSYHDEEQQAYLLELQELFQKYDVEGNGKLSLAQLSNLCHEIELDDVSDVLIQYITDNSTLSKIDFQSFQNAFVKFLSEVMDTDVHKGLDDGGGDQFLDYDKAVSVGSSPVVPKTEVPSDTEMELTPTLNYVGHALHEPIVPSKAGRGLPVNNSETNLGEQELRAIWQQLHVGQNGYLTLPELRHVCQHIGMEEMTENQFLELFDKLDVDSDGMVSFSEFCQGLLQYEVEPETSNQMKSLSRVQSLRSIKSWKLSSEIDSTRGSPLVFGEGVLSSLDTSSNGFVDKSSLCNFWSSLGIQYPHKVVKGLGLGGQEEIKLSEVSLLLDEALQQGSQHIAFEAALLTVQLELKHTKEFCVHILNERDKLQSDLTSLNTHMAKIVKEADDRLTMAEKVKDKEIGELAEKYDNSLKTLQRGLKKEKEELQQEAGRQMEELEQQVLAAKDREVQLQIEKSSLKKDISRLEEEALDFTDFCDSLELTNKKLRDELLHMAELQMKVDEFEAMGLNVWENEHLDMFSKLQMLQDENKRLKDAYDELQEQMDKMSVGHNSSSTVTSHNVSVEVEMSKENEKTRSVIETETVLGSTTDHVHCHEQLHQLERQFSLDRRDIEDQYKLEIAELEDKHMQEKNALYKNFRAQLERQELDLVKKFQDKMDLREKEVSQQMNSLQEKYETERSTTEENFAKDKDELINRFHKEFEEDLAAKLANQRAEYTKELELTVSTDRSEVDKLKEQLNEFKEEQLRYADTLESQVAELTVQFEAECQRLKVEHHSQVLEMDNQLTVYRNAWEQGVSSLQGKLLVDFQKWKENEKRELIKHYDRQLQKEKDLAFYEIVQNKSQFEKELKKKQEEMEQAYQRKVNRFKKSFSDESKTTNDSLKHQLEETQARHGVLTQELENVQTQLDNANATVAELQGDRKTSEQAREELRQRLVRVGEEKDQLEQRNSQLIQDVQDFRNKVKELERLLSVQSRECSVDSDRESVGRMDTGTSQKDKMKYEQQLVILRQSFDVERAQLEGRIEKLQNILYEESKQRQTDQKSKRFADLVLNQDQHDLLQQVQGLKEQVQQLTEDKLEAEDRLFKLQQQLSNTTEQLENERKMQLLKRKVHEKLLSEKKVLMEQLDNLQDELHNSAKNNNVKAGQSSAVHRMTIIKQLEDTTNKLSSVNTALTSSTSQHLHDVWQLREQLNRMVPKEDYDMVLARCTKAEAELNHELKDNESTGSDVDRSSVAKHLQATKKLLHDQIKKLKEQLVCAARQDRLIHDLYVENAHLMRSLESAEHRTVNAERRLLTAEDKCRALQKVLRRVGDTAIG